MSWSQGRVQCLLPPVPQSLALSSSSPSTTAPPGSDRAPSSVHDLSLPLLPTPPFSLKAEVVLGMMKSYLEWQYCESRKQLN